MFGTESLPRPGLPGLRGQWEQLSRVWMVKEHLCGKYCNQFGQLWAPVGPDYEIRMVFFRTQASGRDEARNTVPPSHSLVILASPGHLTPSLHTLSLLAFLCPDSDFQGRNSERLSVGRGGISAELQCGPGCIVQSSLDRAADVRAANEQPAQLGRRD